MMSAWTERHRWRVSSSIVLNGASYRRKQGWVRGSVTLLTKERQAGSIDKNCDKRDIRISIINNLVTTICHYFQCNKLLPMETRSNRVKKCSPDRWSLGYEYNTFGTLFIRGTISTQFGAWSQHCLLQPCVRTTLVEMEDTLLWDPHTHLHTRQDNDTLLLLLPQQTVDADAS